MTGNHLKSTTPPAFGQDDTVQVLSLDGGGLKGLYSASVIRSLEAQLGHSICDHFDIITGTSTGGLIALALGLARTGHEIQRFYVEEGQRIFPTAGLWGLIRGCRWFFSAKFSNKTLEAALRSLLTYSAQLN